MVKVGRNEPCPCGSGRKFKRCCIDKRDTNPVPFADALRQKSATTPPPEAPDRKARDLAELRCLLEDTTAQQRLLGVPRIEALLHANRILAATDQLVQREGEQREGQEFAYEALRSTQDLLRWMTYELMTRTPRGGRAVATGLASAVDAIHLIQHFKRFAVLHELILSAEHGYMRVEPDDAGVLTFYPPEGARGTRLAAGILHGARTRQQERDIAQAEFLAANRDRVLAIGRSLAGTVGVDRLARTMTYRIDDDLLRDAMEVAVPFEVSAAPDEWSFGPYSMGEFRAFHRVLRARVALHEVAYTMASEAMPLDWGPHNSAPLLIDRNQLLRSAAAVSEIRSDAAVEIARDLTYSTAVPWTDLIFQPLIGLDGTRLLIQPTVVDGSNYERNLFALVDRLPWRRRRAAELKNLREDLMLQDLIPVATAADIRCSPRLPVRQADKLVGDVDLAVWNQDTLLLVSLKWFYGPDSIQEVIQHDRWFSDDLLRIRRMAQAIRETLPEFAQRHHMEGLGDNAVVIACIVSQVGVPSEAVYDEEIPIVEVGDFRQVLKDSQRDVRGIHERLVQLSRERATPPEAYRRGFGAIRVGQQLIRIPNLQRDD